MVPLLKAPALSPPSYPARSRCDQGQQIPAKPSNLSTDGGSGHRIQEIREAVQAHLELAGAAEPQVVLPRQLWDSVAGLVDCDAALVAADQLVVVKVHIAVADCAAITSPAHLPASDASASTAHITAHTDSLALRYSDSFTEQCWISGCTYQ